MYMYVCVYIYICTYVYTALLWYQHAIRSLQVAKGRIH
jgi:hypothetical protein